MKYVHCNKCKWTHFEVSKSDVEAWYADWMLFSSSSPEEVIAAYGLKKGETPSPLEEYGKCFRCRGSYKDFSNGSTLTSDGHTIQGIMNRNEDF